MRVYALIGILCVAGCKSGGGSAGDGGGGGGGGNVSPTIMAVATCADAVVGLRIECDGSQSSDSMGRPLTFAWTAVTMMAGGVQNVASGSGPSFAFVPTQATEYLVTLVVSVPDGDNNMTTAMPLGSAVVKIGRAHV